MTRAQAIKQFFSTPEKPVTNHELIEFRKADEKGYDEIGDLCIKALEES